MPERSSYNERSRESRIEVSVSNVHLLHFGLTVNASY
jgi:hypothetical protein